MWWLGKPHSEREQIDVIKVGPTDTWVSLLELSGDA